MSINEWMDRQNTYNGNSLKEEGNSGICYNMDVPWRHAKWKNEPNVKGQVFYHSSCISYLE